MNSSNNVGWWPRVAVVFVLTTVLAAADWPQWRGPTRDGRLPDAVWPESLAENHLSAAWRLDLGPSYSGPVVDSVRVYVTESKDQAYEAVLAVDRSTGETLWRTEWEGYVRVPFFARANGDWIRSTPALDGDRLFVAGMRDVLLCLDVNSGDIVWQVDFVRDTGAPVPAFGFVASPLVVEDWVYVQAGASLAKLDKRTGKIIWRALRDEGGMWGSAFSSPVLATLAGHEQCVVQTREKLAGVDPETGEVLWAQPIKAFRGMNILTPVVVGNDLFTTAYGGRAQGFTVEAGDAGWGLKERWQGRAEGYMSTPVVIGHHAYLHLRNQRVTCLDVRTGEAQWTTDERFGKYWSLVAGRDQILALDERGWLYLLRQNPERFELLDSRRLTEQEAWAHLAVSGKDLYVRDLGGLTAWRWK
jgi:outer membrane protein assembly factor BamB